MLVLVLLLSISLSLPVIGMLDSSIPFSSLCIYLVLSVFSHFGGSISLGMPLNFLLQPKYSENDRDVCVCVCVRVCVHACAGVCVCVCH